MNRKLVFTTSGNERVNLTKSPSKCCLSNKVLLIRITSLWNHSQCLCYTEYSQVPCSCLVLLMCCKLLFVFVLFSVCGIIHFKVLSTSTIWLNHLNISIFLLQNLLEYLVYLGSSCHIYVTDLRYLCHVDFCHFSMTFPATAANSWCLRTWPRSLVALTGAIVM